MTARKNTKRKSKPRVDKKIIEELAEWGITRESVGPILLTLIITAILHQLGVEFSLPPGERLSDEDVRVEEILSELADRGNLEKISKSVPKRTLRAALRTIVRRDADGILQLYDVDDIPSSYSALPHDLEEFLHGLPKKQN